MSKRFIISFDDQDNLQYIYDDALQFLEEIGAAVTKRASHVEPTDHGGWSADMAPSGGEVLGPFNTRAEALSAETDWLRANVLHCS